jgi:hypothetical protein
MNGNKKYINGERLFFGHSRSEKMAVNNLGITQDYNTRKKYRSEKLKVVESYLDDSCYDGLHNWDSSTKDNFIPISKRKPKIIYPFAQVFSERLSSKLCGLSTFPKLTIEEDREADYFLQILINATYIKARLLSASKMFVLFNSVFVRFYLVNGIVKIESHNPNYCYPVFTDDGKLESIDIKYIYDSGETDEQGKPIYKWYRLSLSQTVDIEFDSPIYSEYSEPEFVEVSRNEHNLGFVQGEWFTFGESEQTPDGDREPFICKIKGFIDEINYNLSQTTQASKYGMEPQLVVTGLDSDELDSLIKSSASSWSLGREGDAKFLEVSGSGIEKGTEVRIDLFKRVQDIARVVMLDPDKIVGSAQSAKAMEVLHGPMVEIVNELRPWFEKYYIQLVEKIYTVVVMMNNMGFETQFTMPDGWIPTSMTMKCLWPPIFELTTQDKQQIVSLGIQASNANIISRDTALRWIQSQGVDFGVEDFELEQQKISGQERFNTFF